MLLLSLSSLHLDVWMNKQDSQGAYLIDRSPEYFEPILNYLRHGQLILNEAINPLGILLTHTHRHTTININYILALFIL